MSMGVIYHRKNPQTHILNLGELTRPGGHVVLESIVTTDRTGFKPPGRYARMRNVWHVPSVDELQMWLGDAGLKNVRCLDGSRTTIEEQRPTHWMRFESLAHTLDANDTTRTIEGHPAPVRALLIADK